MEASPKGPSTASSTRRGEDPATNSASRRDRLDTALFVVGFLLLVMSLLGGYLQRPANGSKPSAMSWLLQPPERNAFLKPPAQANLRQAYFDGPLRGWAVGHGIMVMTSDGGQSWRAQASGTTTGLNSIYATGDGKNLWAVGDFGTILHTYD